MYEKLVKQLRRYVEIERSEHHGAELEAEAADAIEELTAIAESYKRSMEAWADEAARAQPRWIPVTERLPEECVGVLCYCSRNGQYGCGGYRKKDNGTIYWIGLNGMIPTHWMPLPEPPKEAHNG